MTEFQALLRSLYACHEAREWVGERSLAEAWEECERVDWLHWLANAAALRAYDAAIAPAQQAYVAATTPAWQAYDAATAEARQAYTAATTPARQAYVAATASARQAYTAAIGDADAFRARIPCPTFSS